MHEQVLKGSRSKPHPKVWLSKQYFKCFLVELRTVQYPSYVNKYVWKEFKVICWRCYFTSNNKYGCLIFSRTTLNCNYRQLCALNLKTVVKCSAKVNMPLFCKRKTLILPSIIFSCQFLFMIKLQRPLIYDCQQILRNRK